MLIVSLRYRGAGCNASSVSDPAPSLRKRHAPFPAGGFCEYEVMTQYSIYGITFEV